MKTAKRAGLKTKDPTPKRQKYILPTPTMSRKTLPVNFGSHGEKPIYEEEAGIYIDFKLAIITHTRINYFTCTTSKFSQS